nr:hypothetical protein [uncultured Rhodoferax sp.]
MSRSAALSALVKVSIPVPEAISNLTQFPWDSDSDLIVLCLGDFIEVLSRFDRGELAEADVEAWANALECREDIGYANSTVRELLHELANPLLTKRLTPPRAASLLSMMQKGSQQSMNDIITAHSHCSSHRVEVLTSSVCGCFYCLDIFAPTAIKDWVDFPPDAPEDQQLDMGTTALCPSCGIDSVIGSNSGYPITAAFLSEMRKHWF